MSSMNTPRTYRHWTLTKGVTDWGHRVWWISTPEGIRAEGEPATIAEAKALIDHYETTGEIINP